jgi:hypothetical protein
MEDGGEVFVLSDGECGGSLDGVPVLLRKGISSLLEALLALGQALVLADSHDCGACCEFVVGVWWLAEGSLQYRFDFLAWLFGAFLALEKLKADDT